MASSIIMQQTRGTASDIADLTPVDGQIVWDKTNNQIKIGNGTSKVSTLKATPEIVNALNSTSANAVLSAAQGKVLNDKIPTVSTATNSTSTTTAASSSAVKAAYDLAQRAYDKAGSGDSSYIHPVVMNYTYATKREDVYPFSGYGTWLYFTIKYTDSFFATGTKGVDIVAGISEGGKALRLNAGEFVVTWRVA